jgi:hypothetical protein
MPERPHRPAASGSRWSRRLRGDARAIALTAALALLPGTSAGERFVPFVEQPDGSVVFVQATPATERSDGRLQGWFRTVPKSPQPVTDEFGFQRQYHDMLALNVGDCFNRRMGASTMVYRSKDGATVARFDVLPGELELRAVRPGTLGESMLTWLCTPRPRSAKPPSAASETPFK